MRKMETVLDRLIHWFRRVVKDLQDVLSGPGTMGRLVP